MQCGPSSSCAWRESEISHVHVMEGVGDGAFDIIIKLGTTGGSDMVELNVYLIP